MNPTVGATATASYTVTDSDTAIALGSGDVPVLATPRLVAWCEAVTVLAVADQLDDGETTVGFKVRVNHLAPTVVGATVTVSAEITEVDRTQVTFEVAATEGETTAASGTITRVAVDRSTFIERAAGS